ncbi:hypothetical protein SUGI_0970120 [Cryptomeria japonica]|nr:hypothetical protein SUGI_0970120 [Cryptomeria japonica]
MAASGNLEKGAVMDPSPGERKNKALRKKAEERVISHLFKLVAHFGLYEFYAEKANPENEWQETKKIWMVGIPILSCNTAVITTMPTTDGSLAQVVLILNTLSFMLTLILVITPIAIPSLRMLNIKRALCVIYNYSISDSAYVGCSSSHTRTRALLSRLCSTDWRADCLTPGPFSKNVQLIPLY